MAVKKGLGKGLDALLGDYAAAPPEGVKQVNVHDIDTNLEQPRKSFDEEKLRELAASISVHGVVQPILVRQNGARFTIVAGERRFRAARLAGLELVPVVVRDMEDSAVLEVALVENLQREDLNPIEEAAGIRFLMQQHDLTQEEVSSRLGKSRPAIANALRLLNLPESVQSLLREGKLLPGHARALVVIKEEGVQEALANRIVAEGLSARQAEEQARLAAEKSLEEGEKRAPRKEKLNADADLAEAEARLREKLATKVSILGSQKSGKLIVEYYSKEDLNALYDLLMQE
ncbi:MAG: ParB/RepB/Spo0J family partition protein [Clostridiaceae bacterium]|nr:ParB/RepB/Spo0J family partition protein [Eubacteriales bacterium]